MTRTGYFSPSRGRSRGPIFDVMNKTRTPVVSRALLISLLALAVMAFAGASGAGPLGLIVSSEDPVAVPGDCPDEGDEVVVEDPDGDADDGTEVEDPEGDPDEDGDDQGEDGDDQGEDGDDQGEDGDDQGEDGDDQGEDGDAEGEDPEGDTEECEPAPEDESEGEDEGTPVDPESREGECSEAAGLVDDEGNAQTVEETYGEIDAPFGQKHSMEVLLANCMKNPQAQGLLRALENHARHLEMWEARAEMRAAREAAKAERNAARQAAKAERMAAHEAAKAARAAAKAAAGHGNGH
jgi:hypothetical protein